MNRLRRPDRRPVGLTAAVQTVRPK